MSTLIAQANNQPLPTTGPNPSSSIPTSSATTTSVAPNKSTSASVLGSTNNNKFSSLTAGLVALGVILVVLLISLAAGAYCYFRRGIKPFSRKRSIGTTTTVTADVEFQKPTSQTNGDEAPASPRSPAREGSHVDSTSPAMSPIVQQLSADPDPVEAPLNPFTRGRRGRMSNIDTSHHQSNGI